VLESGLAHQLLGQQAARLPQEACCGFVTGPLGQVQGCIQLTLVTATPADGIDFRAKPGHQLTYKL
jgi:hypothetical protein